MRVLSLGSTIGLGLAVVLCATGVDTAAAQGGRWRIVPNMSIAWWQVDPHLNHLWASTCTEDATWRPGSDRTAGWSLNNLKLPKAGYANVVDTIPMPAYPRQGQAEPVCTEAVSGGVAVEDQANWGGVNGVILVAAEKLQTGNSMRDRFARQAVLETNRYPNVKFMIDSVTDVQLGDTLRGTFHGNLELIGASRPYSGFAKGWMEGDKLRVQAHFKIKAMDMIDEFGANKYSLGLGVRTGIWRWIFVGVDAVFERIDE